MKRHLCGSKKGMLRSKAFLHLRFGIALLLCSFALAFVPGAFLESPASLLIIS
ncbi:hypothetical protein [Paenibacillus montaniterrae]|uniref:hypothetical protein n=1 Tax=Paenibacillus montaniterrae TaxID=429341 RepID=UPI001BCCC83C|nr:hypothetical protein [Paenibacillus montaniterrae]